ncbi:MAG: hypothetical protein HYY46_07550 [Deltaproteobacteria bacterium]|nr:hypothetical protein [Deltaproteobacteria bacterium]
MQTVLKSELEEASNFLFNATYRMWKSDLKKIFRIGTRGAKGGCNLSSCILVLIGIESFSKFFSKKRTDVDAFADFMDKYYPAQYVGKMKKIYDLFRHGLAHNYYPKSEFNLKNTSLIAFGVDEHDRVVALSRLKRNLDYFRRGSLQLSPKPGKPYVIFPQVLFLDTVIVMEGLKKKIKNDASLQNDFVSNYKKIRRILRHTN